MTRNFTILDYRTEAEAAKAGNVYQYRATCTCGYRGKWTNQGRAEDLLAAHRCYA